MNSLDSLQKNKYKWVMETFKNSQIAHWKERELILKLNKLAKIKIK